MAKFNRKVLASGVNSVDLLNENFESLETLINTGLIGEEGPAGPGLPSGGSTGQTVVKSSGEDYATEWTNLNDLPAGGTNGQVLTKASGDDYDVEWTAAAGTLALLSTTTLAADADEIVISGLTGYTEYLIKFFLLVTDDTQVAYLFSNDGSSYFSANNEAPFHARTESGSGSTNQTGSGSPNITPAAMSTSSQDAVVGEMKIAPAFRSIIGTYVHRASTAGAPDFGMFACSTLASNTFSYIKFLKGAGSDVNGTYRTGSIVKLYGVN